MVKSNNDKEITNKQASLDKTLKQIEKKFGSGAIMKMGDKSGLDVEALPTGIISLDIALGVGGLPRGRVVEIFGPESSGKSTIAMQAVAETQKNGGAAAYIDAENAMDPTYAEKLGVDIDNLLISQPDTGEQGLEIADELVSSGAIDILVVDSVAALVPQAEIDGEMGDAHVGLQARMMSQALRKLTGSIHKTNTLVIFINQLREKVGVMFGSPETTPGGRALKFYSSVRLDVRRAGQVKDGTEVVGNDTKIKVAKNKVAPPFKKVETIMSYGKGIEKNADLISLTTSKDTDFDGIINKSGSWYSYEDTRLGQGANNAANYLDQHPALSKEIENKVREKAGLSTSDNQDSAENTNQQSESTQKETNSDYGSQKLL